MSCREISPQYQHGPKDAAKRILLAAPRGFCAGVERAIVAVESALRLFGSPIYVRKQIVHNQHVISRLSSRGAVFVEELSEVPRGAILIFSAHGVSPAVRRAAHDQRLRVIDATCPLVTKVHLEALEFHKRGLSILFIGHSGHDEVIGVLGELPGVIQLVTSLEDAASVKVLDESRVGVIMQTTLSIDESSEILATLRRRFPSIVLPRIDDICYATQNRQRAVREIALRSDFVIVFGFPNSSNANRLLEVVESCGTAACLAPDIESIDIASLSAIRILGVTAGASTPEGIVERAISWLATKGFTEVEDVVITNETTSFTRPRSFIPARELGRVVE